MEGDELGIHIMKYSSGKAKVVQRSLYLNDNFNIIASYHGKELSEDSVFYKEEVKKFNFKIYRATELASALSRLVSQFRLYEVCHGIPLLKFKPLWHRDEECFVDLNPFQESRYTVTCRSKKCLYAVPQLQRQCKECAKVHKRFSARSVFKDQSYSPSGRIKTPNKYKSIQNLITPEKEARLRRWKKVILNLKRQNDRLREKLAKKVQDEAVDVDRAMDEQLTESLREAEKAGKLTDFHRFFLQEQLKAAQAKSPTGHRWHPFMLRFALQLKMASSVGYATMAKSGFIKLPGVRTLFD